jgi:hypothetical protein
MSVSIFAENAAFRTASGMENGVHRGMTRSEAAVKGTAFQLGCHGSEGFITAKTSITSAF